MKKIKKFFVSIMVLCISYVGCSTQVYAHDLGPWAKEYTDKNADYTYSFGIGNCYHINGNKVNYYWKNADDKKYFSNIMNGATGMWCDIIEASETKAENAELEIQLNPDPTKSRASAKILVNVSNHYVKGGVFYDGKRYPYIELTHGNKIATPERQQETMAHELGHIWGILDLYNENNPDALGNKLDSIYSNKLSKARTEVTRHDKNAMYICLGNPRFLNWDNTLWDQTAPKKWKKVGLLGDLNLDGTVSLEDSQLALKGYLNSISLSETQKKLMDYDGNLKLEMEDAQLILNDALGII